MAERARSTKGKGKSKNKPPKGAQGSRGKVAKTDPGPGHNSGEVSPALIWSHHDKINGIEIRLVKAKAAYDKIKGELRSAYAVVKQDGLVVDDFKLARELDKKDHGEVIRGYDNVGIYLAGMKSDLATVTGLFTDIAVLDAMNAKIAGAAAFKDKVDRGNNPHQAGTEAFVEWDTAWMGEAEKAKLAEDGGGDRVVN